MPSLAVSRLLRSSLLALCVAASGAAQAETKVLINPGDQGEQSRFAVYSEFKDLIEQALRRQNSGAVSISMSFDATSDLSGTRSRLQDVIIAPAHVIGSATRNGYTPLMSLESPVQAVLVAPTTSSIDSLAAAQGKRLGLPQQDSVVTYLMRGEIHARNTTLKRHFGPIYETRWQDALLICLQIRRCDVVAVERAVYLRWVAAGQPVKEILQSKPVPGIGVAVKEAAAADGLRTALSEAVRGKISGAKVVALTPGDFTYVATLGYFTPRVLQGATLVDAATVNRMRSAVPIIDTRNLVEYREGHLPGAVLVPYVEKSPKDPDYDASLDQFDLTKLPQDKKAPIIFACNGPECWKSFKASHAAIAAGYTGVYWFRGGFPEWRQAGLEIATGDNPNPDRTAQPK